MSKSSHAVAKVAVWFLLPAALLVPASGAPRGSLWGWGSEIASYIPLSASNVVAVSAGYSHGLALLRNGTVLAFGPDNYGETHVPSGLSNVTAVAAGWFCSLAVKSNGKVVGWGRSATLAHSVPAGLGNVIAVAAGDETALALRRDGSVVEWGLGAAWTNNVSGIQAIAAGGAARLALGSNGIVFAWGDRTNVPPGLTNVVAVAAGAMHSVALTENSSVIEWSSHVGVITSNRVEGAIRVAAGGLFTTIVLKHDGTATGWGEPRVIPPGTLSNILAVAVGHNFGAGENFGIAITRGPFLAKQPADLTNSLGGTATFACRAIGIEPFEYQWKHNGTIVAGATNRTLTLSNLHGPDNGEYNVSVRNRFGSFDSRAASLFVPYAPRLVQAFTNQTVPAGADVNLAVDALGAPLFYEWYFRSNRLDAWGPTLLLTNVQVQNTGRYTTIIYNDMGRATNLARLTVAPLPPSILRSPTNTSQISGNTVRLSVEARGTEPLAYQWAFKGSNIPFATNAILTLEKLKPLHGGMYRVHVSNPHGDIDSQSAEMKITVLPDFQWTRQTGATNATSSGLVTTDSAGSVYGVGSFQGSGMFGETNRLSQRSEVWIAKFGSEGNLLWWKMYGGEDDDYPGGLTVDKDFNVYVTGRSRAPAVLAGTPVAQNAFIVKLDLNGNFAWNRRLWVTNSGPGDQLAAGTSIAVDAENNLIAAGNYNGSALLLAESLGSDQRTTALTNAGGTDLYVARFAQNGDLLWAKRAGGRDSDGTPQIACDFESNIFFVSETGRSFDLFGDRTFAGDRPLVIAKLSREGNVLWATNTPYEAWTSAVPDLAVDPSGNVYVTSLFAGYLHFGTGELRAEHGPDAFLAKLSGNGQVLWVRRISEPVPYAWPVSFSRVATERSGHVMALVVTTPIEVSGAWPTSYRIEGGSWVSAYAGDGSSVWHRTAMTNDNLQLSDLTLDYLGDAYAVGKTSRVESSFPGPVITTSDFTLSKIPDAFAPIEPRLRYRTYESNLVLSWSAAADGFSLSVSDDPKAQTSDFLPSEAIDEGFSRRATVPLSEPRKFFRLVR